MSFREMVRRVFLDRLEDEGSVDLKAETVALVDLVRTDPEFLELFLSEYLGPTIARIGEQSLNRPRPPRANPTPMLSGSPAPRPVPTRPEPTVRTGERVQTVSQLRKEIEEEVQKSTWLPLAAKSVKPIDLMQMNKFDVMELAKRHTANAVDEAITARWLYKIAVQMDDGELVGDRFTVNGLHVMHEEADADQRGISFSNKPRSIAS